MEPGLEKGDTVQRLSEDEKADSETNDVEMSGNEDTSKHKSQEHVPAKKICYVTEHKTKIKI